MELSEYQIQCQVVDYLEILKSQRKIVLFTAIPNSTFTKSWGVKIKNTKMGVRPGLCDMLIVTPYRLLFLELKKEKHGVVSKYQKEWIEAINLITDQYTTDPVIARVCAGFEAAKAFFDEYI